MKQLFENIKLRFCQTLCNLEAWAYGDYASNPHWWNSLIGALAFILWIDFGC